MKKSFLLACTALATLLATTTTSFAEEYSFSARAVCEPLTESAARRLPGDLFAWESTGFNQFFCNLPKNVNRGIKGAYVRVKPGYSRSGGSRMSCIMGVHHPYGNAGGRSNYGGSVYANGTNVQSLYVWAPSSYNKWGQIVIRCTTNSGDDLFGVHLQQ